MSGLKMDVYTGGPGGLPCSIPSVPSLSCQDKTKATPPVGIQYIKAVWVKSTLITPRILEANLLPPPPPPLPPYWSLGSQSGAKSCLSPIGTGGRQQETGASALR